MLDKISLEIIELKLKNQAIEVTIQLLMDLMVANLVKIEELKANRRDRK